MIFKGFSLKQIKQFILESESPTSMKKLDNTLKERKLKPRRAH